MSDLQHVVVWERRSFTSNGKVSWEPYNADVSHLLERSFINKLKSVCLGDVDSAYGKQFVYFEELLQRTEETTGNAGIPVRRNIYYADSCPGRGIVWQWFDDQTNDWRFYIIDTQEQIERAYQKGESGIDLSQVLYSLPYILDLAHMVQRRKSTGTRRPVKRCESRPYPVIILDQTISESSSFVRRSERLALKKASSLDCDTNTEKGHDSTDILERSSITDNLSSRSPPLSGSSKFLNWFKTPIFKTRSTPVNNSAAVQLSKATTTDPFQRKFIGASLLSHKNKKRPSYKNRIVVPRDRVISKCNLTPHDLILKYCYGVTRRLTDNCTICYESLSDSSSYDNRDCVALSLSRCSHTFHRACLIAMLSNQSPVTHIQCPTCKVIYGCKIGNQPPGKMEYYVVKTSLPGYEGNGTICILYNFKDGIQGPEHPHPNESYSAWTFPRTCYLPDNDKGRKVLGLLIIAWQRRLTFTIGSSVTTGDSNVVTWNEIHHKTEFHSNHSGHGYPDSNYLDNVLFELAAQGVTDEETQ